MAGSALAGLAHAMGAKKTANSQMRERRQEKVIVQCRSL
jgi:hypothetical protein